MKVRMLVGGVDSQGRKYDLKNMILKGEYYGTLDNTSTVELSKISHKVTNLRVEDNSLVGDLLILKTPMGQILESLLEAGVITHMSTVGLGQVKDNIVTEFKMIGINVVKED